MRFEENGLCLIDGYNREIRKIKVRKVGESTYLHSISSIMKNNKRPKSMVINLEQAPSKYVPDLNTHWHPKESKVSQLLDQQIREQLQQHSV